MCGIAGFCDFGKKSSQGILEVMTDALEHRGPDSAGYDFFDVRDAHVGLGHRRLSILDLTKSGSQPMSDESGRYVIIFNGEIYNFKEIRNILEEEGFSFFSSSDTEVVLKAYMRWGVEAVHRFIGMFAFVIFDKEKNKLVIFRDRAGVKPLYYYYADGCFLFSSELKSLICNQRFSKEIDLSSLALFFKFGYVPTPNAIFKDTYKLKPGHFLELDLSTRDYRVTKYWDVYEFYNKPKVSISENEAVLETEGILKSAFNYRMVADVPVGVFLSGGYDSVSVAAILQSDMTDRLKTFTIGFQEEKYNEAHEAREIASFLGTDHIEHYCTEKETKEVITSIPYYYDEPFCDSSAIPTMLVSKLARESVTVALSGDGGDETFAGYGHTQSVLNEFRTIQGKSARIKRVIGQGAGALFNATKSYRGFNRYLVASINALGKYSGRYENECLESIITRGRCSDYKIFRLLNLNPNLEGTLFRNFSKFNSNVSSLGKCLAVDYQNYMMDDILTKVDRATMAVSLEGREPLLDHRIIEFVARLPDEFKYHDGVKKKILRDVVHKFVPEHLMNRPKKGFFVPVRDWFRADLKGYVYDYLSEDKLNAHHLFESNYVNFLKTEYLRTGRGFNLVWPILMFQMWYERWMS